MSVSDSGTGSTSIPNWTTTYAYDAAARLHAVLDPRVSAKPFLYTYDTRASVVAQLAMPTGQTIAYARDAQGRLLSTTLSGTAHQTLATHAYTYDLAGQRTTASTASATTAYTYDALRQLATATETPAGTSQTPTREFAYAYDTIGNRLTAATAAETTTYTANSVNQYTAIVSQISNSQISDTPAYDANGNTTTLPSGLVLDYDEENRLVSAATPTAREEYTYDGLGRRVERRTFTAAADLIAPATTTRYVYDGWRILEELASTQSSPFTLQSSYTRGLDLSGTLEGAGGIGGLLAMTRDPAGIATSAYYFHDGNGNVSTLVSASDALVASYTYTPFGDTLTATGTWASVNAYRFSAKECDAFTSLYYYGLRYYTPSTGRWINPDPIEEDGGVNLYAFVENSPILEVDSIGLSLDDRGMSYVSLAAFTKGAAGWLGATVSGGNISYKGKDVITESSSCCQDGTLFCAEITEAQEVDVFTYSKVVNDQLGKRYTESGLSAIVDHENRRRMSVVKGYSAFIDVYNNKNKSCGKICSTTPGEAKERLKKWLEKFRESAVDEHKSYVARQRDGISAENGRHRMKTVKIPNPSKPGKMMSVDLIDGTNDPYELTEPGNFKVRTCPKSDQCK